MASVTPLKVTIEFSDDDRQLLVSLRDAILAGQTQSDPEPESDELTELSQQALARAKVLMRAKKHDQIKAVLDELGLERVTHMTTVEQARTFLEKLEAL